MPARQKNPESLIPTPAELHRGAALHYEEAARHHREAAKHHDSGDHEEASQHAHMGYAHHLHAEQDAEEAAKAHIRNHLDDSHQLERETHNKSGRIETF
jgi:hypothetical protein